MKVSVIVLAYNQEGTIARTLDSILAQEVNFRYEIVVGEDASTDGTRAIAIDYAKRFPEIIRLMPEAPNKGPVANYFACLDAAKGKYIADCAADDYWTDTHKLSRQIEILDADSEVALVHTAWHFIDSETSHPHRYDWNPIEPYTADKGALSLRILMHDPAVSIHSCTSVYRKESLAKIIANRPDLFLDPDNTCEDLPIAVALAHTGKIAYIPDDTLCYELPGKDSVSSPDNFERHALFLIGTLHQIIRLQQFIGATNAQMHSFYSHRIDYTLSQIFHSRNSDIYKSFRRICAAKPLPCGIKGRIYKILIPLTTKKLPRNK